MTETHSPHLRVVELRLDGYKAFDQACLSLSDLTVLSGPNGAGKSTLLDAFSFVREALSDSLPTALERRGGGHALLRRASSGPARLTIGILLKGPSESFVYGFTLTEAATRLVVETEFLLPTHKTSGFQRKGREVREILQRQVNLATGKHIHPKVEVHSLAFPLMAAAYRPWTRVLETLKALRVYAISPASMRSAPPIEASPALKSDGSNAGDVLEAMLPHDLDWIFKYLNLVVPEVQTVQQVAIAGRRDLVFSQQTESGTIQFNAQHASAGTLRTLGILLALRQKPAPSLVAIDEIEDSLHPSAVGLLLGAVSASSREFPVVITSHSPEVLRNPVVLPDSVRLIHQRAGKSHVYPVPHLIQEHLQPPDNLGDYLETGALYPSDPPFTFSDVRSLHPGHV